MYVIIMLHMNYVCVEGSPAMNQLQVSNLQSPMWSPTLMNANHNCDGLQIGIIDDCDILGHKVLTVIYALNKLSKFVALKWMIPIIRSCQSCTPPLINA